VRSVSTARVDIGESEKIVGERLQIFVRTASRICFLRASTFVSRACILLFVLIHDGLVAFGCSHVVQVGKHGAMGSSNGTTFAPMTMA
jgi:hypothetical protein